MPVMFEAALNRLKDEDVVGRSRHEIEQRLSGRRIIRDQIDILLDRSDLFVGIYYMSAGHRDYILNDLSWIEYEKEVIRWRCFVGEFSARARFHGIFCSVSGPVRSVHP